jgi:Ser/Thr protein kinase RdoA (MazF antagonist)
LTNTRLPQAEAGGGSFARASSITQVAAAVSIEEAAGVAAAVFGIRARLRRMIGERDQNYALQAEDGRGFALKIIHPAEDPAITDFQTSLLRHLAAADPALPVQRVVPALDGRAESAVRLADGTRRMVRMTTFLPGTIQRGLPPSENRGRNLGALLARIQLALAEFAHPADAHEIAWDIQHTAQQRAVIPEIGSAHQRALMEEAIGRFEARALPAMSWLRRQVLHNDLSGDNVVVDPRDPDRIAGILDFGDATRTAVINDLAIAVSYNLVETGNPLEGGLGLVAGFHAVKPLLREELDLLLDLVIARLVVRVGITEWRATRFPDNRDYILRTTPQTWRFLEALLRLPASGRVFFHGACGLG